MKKNIFLLFLIIGFSALTAPFAQGADTAATADTDTITDTVSSWPNGNAKETRRFNINGKLAEQVFYREGGSVEKYLKFDNEGHKVEESYYDEDHQLEATVDGWAAMRWVYQDGKLAVETYYGENGKVQERKFYNESGDLVKRQYVGDENIDPNEYYEIPPQLNIARVDEEYDDNGRLIERTAVEDEPFL